jgi:hypothetical protein
MTQNAIPSTHHWYATIGFVGCGPDAQTMPVESRRMAQVDAEGLAPLTEMQRVDLAADGEVTTEEGVLRIVSCNCRHHLVRVASLKDLVEDPALSSKRLLGRRMLTSSHRTLALPENAL